MVRRPSGSTCRAMSSASEFTMSWFAGDTARMRQVGACGAGAAGGGKEGGGGAGGWGVRVRRTCRHLLKQQTTPNSTKPSPTQPPSHPATH